MDLHSAGHHRGVVSAPHHGAVEAGRAILAEGGNALEAMVAMAAAIAAVFPHMNHLGGDGFWLVRERSGRVRALMAAGPAGRLAEPELYRNYETIPARGPLAALTVPGAVGGWMLALEAAKGYGGALPLDLLLTPAMAHARHGYVVTRSQARLTREFLDELKPVPGFAPTFLIEDKPPQPGAILKQEALAETLGHLAHAGLDDFYRGDVGREIAADLDYIGSPVTRDDLVNYSARLADPLSVELDGGTIFNTGAPTQGVASLMILALFARLGVTEAEGFDHLHGLIEATKRAFRARDRSVTDPNYLTHPLERYLEPRFLAGEAMKIDRRKAARWPLTAGDGDTVWMGAADTSGLVVSYIQSVYWEFGSGCVLPRTGIMMQNRGASFSLQTGALNKLAPGRRRSTRSIRRWLFSRTAASWPTAPWAATASRRRKVLCSRGTSSFASRSPTRSTARAGFSAAPGARRKPRCASSRGSTAISSISSQPPATTSMCWTTPIPTRWVTPAP